MRIAAAPSFQTAALAMRAHIKDEYPLGPIVLSWWKRESNGSDYRSTTEFIFTHPIYTDENLWQIGVWKPSEGVLVKPAPHLRKVTLAEIGESPLPLGSGGILAHRLRGTHMEPGTLTRAQLVDIMQATATAN